VLECACAYAAHVLRYGFQFLTVKARQHDVEQFGIGKRGVGMIEVDAIMQQRQRGRPLPVLEEAGRAGKHQVIETTEALPGDNPGEGFCSDRLSGGAAPIMTVNPGTRTHRATCVARNTVSRSPRPYRQFAVRDNQSDLSP